MSIQETQTPTEEQAVITLTEGAVAKVKELIAAETEENLALRVAVRPGGCSGFSYERFFGTDVASGGRGADVGGGWVAVGAETRTQEDGMTIQCQAAPARAHVRAKTLQRTTRP